MDATVMQVALAWLLQRSPSVLLILGTSSVAHLQEDLAVATLALPHDAVSELETIGGSQPLFNGHRMTTVCASLDMLVGTVIGLLD